MRAAENLERFTESICADHPWDPNGKPMVAGADRALERIGDQQGVDSGVVGSGEDMGIGILWIEGDVTPDHIPVSDQRECAPLNQHDRPRSERRKHLEQETVHRFGALLAGPVAASWDHHGPEIFRGQRREYGGDVGHAGPAVHRVQLAGDVARRDGEFT